jgi:hypothetical protein
MKNIDHLIERLVDPADYVQYTSARSFLKLIPPVLSDPSRGAYISKCLLLQDWANTTRGHLLYELIDKRSHLLSKESAWRESLRDEGVRSADERTTALHGNPQYRVLKEEVDELQLAADRMSAIEWILKSAIK